MENTNDRETGSPCDWAVPDNARLGTEEVHVWRASLDVADDEVRPLEPWLSMEEQQRAARFLFPHDRRRFVVRRAVLRALLGRHLGAPPSRVAFTNGPYGKPALAYPFDNVGLFFSLSHSKDLALFALTYNRAVGVDVEWIRPLSDAIAIARTHFSEGENVALSSLSPGDRTVGFFNCWTRKEAYVKATGEGLSRRLDSFEVSLAPGEPARLLSSANANDGGPWLLRGLTPAPGFVGAVVAAGDQWVVRCWHWTDVTP
jgi:4'-phosphopantetheinyl transferase